MYEIALRILTSLRYMKFISTIFSIYRLTDKNRQPKKSPLIQK